MKRTKPSEDDDDDDSSTPWEIAIPELPVFSSRATQRISYFGAAYSLRDAAEQLDLLPDFVWGTDSTCRRRKDSRPVKLYLRDHVEDLDRHLKHTKDCKRYNERMHALHAALKARGLSLMKILTWAEENSWRSLLSTSETGLSEFFSLRSSLDLTPAVLAQAESCAVALLATLNLPQSFQRPSIFHALECAGVDVLTGARGAWRALHECLQRKQLLGRLAIAPVCDKLRQCLDPSDLSNFVRGCPLDAGFAEAWFLFDVEEDDACELKATRVLLAEVQAKMVGKPLPTPRDGNAGVYTEHAIESLLLRGVYKSSFSRFVAEALSHPFNPFVGKAAAVKHTCYLLVTDSEARRAELTACLDAHSLRMLDRCALATDFIRGVGGMSLDEVVASSRVLSHQDEDHLWQTPLAVELQALRLLREYVRELGKSWQEAADELCKEKSEPDDVDEDEELDDCDV